MSLCVLTDDQIRVLLETLTAEEAEEFRDVLKGALHDYSNGTQAVGAAVSEIHQPDRTTVRSASTGVTTLFMPSCSPAGVGIKVITLSSPQADSSNQDDSRPIIRPTGAITLFSSEGSPVGILHASTLTAFRTALASACLLIKRNRLHSVTVFGCGLQAFWHVRLALLFRGSTIRHVNIINRRFSDNCKAILKRFYGVPVAVKEREGWRDATFSVLTPGYGEYARLHREHVRSADVIFCCTPSTEPLFDAGILTSHEGRRKGRLIVAVGSYTPHMRELPVELLHQAIKPHERGHYHYHRHAPEGGVVVVDTLDGALKEAGEIIEAGLTPQQLVELGELVMLRKMAMEESESETSSANASSTFLPPGPPSAEFEKLDLSSLGSSSSAMSSVFSSEASGGGRRGSSRTTSPSRSGSGSGGGGSHRRSSSHGSVDRRKSRDDQLARWLQAGNVIYKSVGLGLMDLTVGMHLVRVAREKGVGSHIEGF